MFLKSKNPRNLYELKVPGDFFATIQPFVLGALCVEKNALRLMRIPHKGYKVFKYKVFLPHRGAAGTSCVRPGLVYSAPFVPGGKTLYNCQAAVWHSPIPLEEEIRFPGG